jgi:hypothetical protein
VKAVTWKAEFAFVEFADEITAIGALYLHGTQWRHQTLSMSRPDDKKVKPRHKASPLMISAYHKRQAIQRAHYSRLMASLPKMNDANNMVFVTGYHERTTIDDIRDLFTNNEIRIADIHKAGARAYVTLVDPADVDRAQRQLNGDTILDQPIIVDVYDEHHRRHHRQSLLEQIDAQSTLASALDNSSTTPLTPGTGDNETEQPEEEKDQTEVKTSTSAAVTPTLADQVSALTPSPVTHSSIYDLDHHFNELIDNDDTHDHEPTSGVSDTRLSFGPFVRSYLSIKTPFKVIITHYQYRNALNHPCMYGRL